MEADHTTVEQDLAAEFAIKVHPNYTVPTLVGPDPTRSQGVIPRWIMMGRRKTFPWIHAGTA